MKLIKLDYKKILIFFSFIYLVSAINNPFNIPNSLTLLSIISFFRGIAPLLLLPIFLIYIFINIKKIKMDLVYKLFIVYLVAQLPYYFYFEFISFNEVYWVLCGISVVSFFIILQNENNKINKQILILFLILILIIASKFTYNLYSEYINNYINIPKERSNFYGFTTMAPNVSFLEQPVPRSSGLSRMLMVLFLFVLIYHIYSNNNRQKNLISLIILLFINFTLFHLQSRLIFIFQLFLIIFFIFFPIYNFNLRKKFLILLIVFVTPFFLHVFEPKIRNLINSKISDDLQKKLIIIKYYRLFQVINQANTQKKLIILQNNFMHMSNYIFYERDKAQKKQIIIEEDKAQKKKIPDKKNKIEEEEVEINLKLKIFIKDLISDQRISHRNLSGRKELWTASLLLVKNNNWLGFGPQADRVLLKQNVSGLLFYSLFCGGIFSFLSMIAIIFILFFKCMKLIIVEKIFLGLNSYFCLSILLMGLLLVRSIGEITFGIFGIDMIIFFISYNIISRYKPSLAENQSQTF